MQVSNKVDIAVLEALRSISTQKRYLEQGKTKTLDSKHLKQEDGYSHAVDLAIKPIDWNDTKSFIELSDLMFEESKNHGIKLRWGGDWDMDGDMTDQRFNDLVHFEINKFV